jgi:hypothetical protein
MAFEPLACDSNRDGEQQQPRARRLIEGAKPNGIEAQWHFAAR